MREGGEVKRLKWWWGQRRLRLTERKREAGVETRRKGMVTMVEGASECRVNNFHLRGCNHPLPTPSRGMDLSPEQKERGIGDEKNGKRKVERGDGGE